jgi:aconitate hydratase
MLIAPPPLEQAPQVALIKGPNIATLPELEPLPDNLELPVLLKVGDDISTDEIMPAGGRVLPFRSNIPTISEFAFDVIDESYPRRAKEVRERGGHAVVGGANYGQGSSREHAALAPRYLGLRVVIAKSFARIHWQNLVNFGVLPLTFADGADYERLAPGDVIQIADLHASLAQGHELAARIAGKDRSLTLRHDLSARQLELLRAGGIINWLRAQKRRPAAGPR